MIEINAELYVMPTDETLKKSNGKLKSVWYKVVGYRIGTRTKEGKDYEEICSLVVIENGNFYYLYPSQCVIWTENATKEKKKQ